MTDDRFLRWDDDTCGNVIAIVLPSFICFVNYSFCNLIVELWIIRADIYLWPNKLKIQTICPTFISEWCCHLSLYELPLFPSISGRENYLMSHLKDATCITFLNVRILCTVAYKFPFLLELSSSLFLSGFPTQYFVCVFYFTHANSFVPSFSYWFDHCNNQQSNCSY